MNNTGLSGTWTDDEILNAQVLQRVLNTEDSTVYLHRTSEGVTEIDYRIAMPKINAYHIPINQLAFPSACGDLPLCGEIDMQKIVETREIIPHTVIPNADWTSEEVMNAWILHDVFELEEGVMMWVCYNFSEKESMILYRCHTDYIWMPINQTAFPSLLTVLDRTKDDRVAITNIMKGF